MNRLDPELEVNPDIKPPYAIAVASFVVSMLAAWLVCHLTDYRLWFAVGYTTYTLVGLACYWAFASNAHEQLIDTQPENDA